MLIRSQETSYAVLGKRASDCARVCECDGKVPDKKKKKEEKLLILFSDTLLLVKVAEDFNMHAGSLVNEAWRWEVE